MKKLVLLLFILSSVVYAQRPNREGQGPNHDKIKAFKTAHITEQLDLSSAEAEKFWPVYNAFDDKLMALRKEGRNEISLKLRNGGIDTITDEEANILIDKMLAMKTTEFLAPLRKGIDPRAGPRFDTQIKRPPRRAADRGLDIPTCRCAFV